MPRKKAKPKNLNDPTARVEPATCPDDVWALDFQFDSWSGLILTELLEDLREVGHRLHSALILSWAYD